MDDMNRDLSAIEQELQALAAQGRKPQADDAALLERLARRADAICEPRRTKPWYRSPAWRCAAVLALLAVPSALWWFDGETQAVVRSAGLKKADVATQAAPPPQMAPTAALAAEMMCGVPECLPEHAPAIAALGMVDEAITDSAVAIATYSGGMDAALPMPQAIAMKGDTADTWSCDAEEEDAEDALAVHLPMERSMPAMKSAQPTLSLSKRARMTPPAPKRFLPTWHKLHQQAEKWMN